MEFSQLNFLDQKILVPAGCLVLFLLIFFPRLKNMMEITVLKELTAMVGPPTDVNPREVYSKQNYLEAAKSVQRALAHNYKATNWTIKVVTIEDPIERAIRVTGNSFLAPATVATPNTVQGDGKAALKSMAITVQVDVFHLPGGSRTIWKYSPADPTEYQRRVQLGDRNVTLLLGRTNYSLMRELHARRSLN
ncbi:MAG TPA: hypothetical protein PLC15_22630 [Candidatus Obscuribacter sp.]|nr:hypothetical protein [Candidatus Obscuribacter sp.]MBK9278444.1 hypothetical protein [Candidatus Obscuribacter sp.]HMY55043.1 hypothetical protein [Candidatus Obscuribacter sp.]HNB18201.1 hypothetical protein [Candidatus Obscuribacter sp.]HNH76515.1 hypothetical protein [Candidatus Obscuribacter sp.]